MQQPPGHPEATENRAARDQEVFQSKSIKQCVQKFHNRGQQFSGTFREHHLSAMHTYKYSRRCCPHCLTGLELNQLSLQIIVFLVSYKPVPVASNRTWQQPGCYIWFGSVVQLLHPLLHPLIWLQKELSFWGSYLTTWKHKKPQNPLQPTTHSSTAPSSDMIYLMSEVGHFLQQLLLTSCSIKKWSMPTACNQSMETPQTPQIPQSSIPQTTGW